MRILLPFLIFALILSETRSQPPSRDAFDKLVKIKNFTFFSGDAAGTLSEGEYAYRQILSSRSALADFILIFQNGTCEAQCYALVGIEILDPKLFKELSTPLLNDSRESSHQVTYELYYSFNKDVADCEKNCGGTIP